MKSQWQLHVEKWKDGCGAEICDRANKVCLGRGALPAHVLFVGEAPGDSENVLGRPFVGPAGTQFEKYVIRRAIPHRKIVDPKTKVEKWEPIDIKYAITNLTGCIPTNDKNQKDGAPDPNDVVKCAPRLLEFIALCQPKLIVCVGKESALALDPSLKQSVWHYTRGSKHLSIDVPRIEILHPAFILRQNISVQGFKFQQTALVVENAIEEHVLSGRKVVVYDNVPDDEVPF